MLWIDTHVHLFSQKDNNEDVPLVNGSLNTAEFYLKSFAKKSPKAIVVVDFSKSKNSQHVISSLDDLKVLGIPAAGAIKATLEDNTFNWIRRDDVKALRFYGMVSVPDFSTESDKWQQLFSILRKEGKHMLAFGNGDNLNKLVKMLPDDIDLAIDHLGCPHSGGGAENKNFRELLEIVKGRNNIYFKGPGYRTFTEVEKVKPVVDAILECVGDDRLIIGASDAPFAGPVPEYNEGCHGKNFSDLFNYDNIQDFIAELAKSANAEKLLFSNAARLYGFSVRNAKVA